ncbi:hypothetical protein TWF694_002571 [Orbilia ellipsospora]|uniref:Uncharacterized protein n=1 Tax=Orbilia ellipsospora TaxID=2528407 RepID=A0AAV9X2E6_9PEZI
MKLESSKPGALSFKVPETGQEEIRPPLTPATEVDLQKSCAILVQSAGYSKSFSKTVSSTTTTTTTAQRKAHTRQDGTVPVRIHNRKSSKSGNRTPVARAVSKGHKRTASAVRFEKTSTSNYVPPRRPAPEKYVSAAKHRRKGKDEKKVEEDVAVQEAARDINGTSKQESDKASSTHVERLSAEKDRDRKSSEGTASEEDGKNPRGMKKLVVNMQQAMTGYKRPQENNNPASPQSAEESLSPLGRGDKSQGSPIAPTEQAKLALETKIKSSKRKDGTTYVEALPEYLHKKNSDEDMSKKPGEVKRSVSKRLGHSIKEYVKPPQVDRFTPEPLRPSTSKDDLKKAENKRRSVAKSMKEYVRPAPLDTSISAIKEEEQEPSPAKSDKTIKSAKSHEKLPKDEKSPAEPLPLPPVKDTPKPPAEPKLRHTSPSSHHNHNPFRMIHDYVKPTMVVEPAPTIQTSVPPTGSLLSPQSIGERKPLAPQRSQPSMSYVPPKIRPRGKTLPGSEAPSEDNTAPAMPTRHGPIFGGGYPVKQEGTLAPTSNKENRSPVSPGFFGRNANGSGFRIHFSHFLHKQRSDGYDQLE